MDNNKPEQEQEELACRFVQRNRHNLQLKIHLLLTVCVPTYLFQPCMHHEILYNN